MKIFAVFPLALCLSAPVAYAAHPEKVPEKVEEKPTQTLNIENLDDLEFTDREMRVIREQIKAAQKRADRANEKAPAKSLSESLKDIKLPTETEIEEMQAQLPDLNALMAGIMKLTNNEEMKNGMAKSADRLRETFEGQEFETDDGMPDLNAMMATMLSLMGDEELVGGMIEAIEPIAELMDDIADAAQPE